MKKIELRASGQGEPVTVEIDGEIRSAGACTQGEERRVVLDGSRREICFHEAGDGSGWLRHAGRVIPFAAVRGERSIDVWIGGRVYRFELIERTPRRAAGAEAAAAPRDLTAPMPGTIVRINVEPGYAFEAHEPLVVMESMKMEMTLSAPFAGRVTDVLGAAGDLVEMGAILARLEARDDEEAPGGEASGVGRPG